jgi:glutathione S-transferase
MYKLYYSPGTCSMAVHVALNEINQPVTLEKVDIHGAQKPAELLAVNPRGQVPVLVDGDITIREGAAILTYLLEKHDSALLPKSGKEHALALEWMMFANATMHPAYSRCFFLKKNKADEALLNTATDMLNKLWTDVDQRLASNKYVCGDKMTIGDILLTVYANWSGNVAGTVVLGPNVKRLLKEVSARSAYKKALQEEQVEYKAAA